MEASSQVRSITLGHPGGVQVQERVEAPIPEPQLLQGCLSSGCGCSIVPGWGFALGCWPWPQPPQLPNRPWRHRRVVVGGGMEMG